MFPYSLFFRIRLFSDTPAAQLVDAALHRVAAVLPRLGLKAVVEFLDEPAHVVLNAVECFGFQIADEVGKSG